jgi:hypothetical protein
MGGGRIFLKSLRDTSFNKDLSNETNVGRIHLANTNLLMAQSFKTHLLMTEGKGEV